MIYGVTVHTIENGKRIRSQFIECANRNRAQDMAEALQFVPDISVNPGCKLYPAAGSSVILSYHQMRDIADAWTGNGASTGKPSFVKAAE